MQRLDSASVALPMDDVPAPPRSYGEYVQRRLRESIRKAYVRGFNRGCRRQVLVLCCSGIFGCVTGFYMAVSGEWGACYRAHAPSELIDDYAAAASSQPLTP